MAHPLLRPVAKHSAMSSCEIGHRTCLQLVDSALADQWSASVARTSILASRMARYYTPIVTLENLEMFERMGVSFSYLILADAHFSHDTPRNSVVDLPVACFPRAREPGSTPSNRRAPQVCRKAPQIDRGRPPAVDLSVAPLARLALGVGHRQARNGRSLGIVPAFVCSGPGRCVAENLDDPSFQAKSEI